MHIPDGFLDAKTLAASATFAAGGLGIALWRTHESLPRRRVPLMGLAGAFIFAAQMLNFPVAGGTSGHLIGGTLAAILLGPSAAVLVLAAVLIVQCLLFADGGLLALGANILLMGMVDSLTGYYVYRAVSKAWKGTRGRLVGAAVGAWCGTVLSALLCAALLVFSGAARAGVVVPAMVGVHALIGIGEAAITVLAVTTIAGTRRELLEPAAPAKGSTWEFALYGSLVAAALAVFISPLASTEDDGLTKISKKLGFAGREVASPMAKSPLADYTVGAIHWSPASTAVAGLIGTLIVFGVALLAAKLLAKRKTEPADFADAEAPPSAA